MKITVQKEITLGQLLKEIMIATLGKAPQVTSRDYYDNDTSSEISDTACEKIAEAFNEQIRAHLRREANER